MLRPGSQADQRHQLLHRYLLPCPLHQHPHREGHRLPLRLCQPLLPYPLQLRLRQAIQHQPRPLQRPLHLLRRRYQQPQELELLRRRS